MYPRASVEMEMTATQAPYFKISNFVVLGTGSLVIKYWARLSNGSLVNLFTTNVTIGCSFSVNLENMKIVGKVSGMFARMKVTDSRVGWISDFFLNAVFNLASEFYITPKLNEFLRNGMPIPSVRGIQLYNSSVYMESHAIRVTTDVNYTTPQETKLYFNRKHVTGTFN